MSDIQEEIEEMVIDEVDLQEDAADDVDGNSDVSEVVVEEVEVLGEWYIVQCMTGKEYRVRDRIQELIDIESLQDKIFRVLVPEEETIEIKNNKRHERLTRIYPGYVFVNMAIDTEILWKIRQLSGVAKFIGTKTAPTPVSEEDILRVLRKVGDKTKKVDVDFEIDEVIKVIAGPFRGYSGSISEINVERGKLKALISIFGRETPVELDFDQVEKTVK